MNRGRAQGRVHHELSTDRGLSHVFRSYTFVMPNPTYNAPISNRLCNDGRPRLIHSLISIQGGPKTLAQAQGKCLDTLDFDRTPSQRRKRRGACVAGFVYHLQAETIRPVKAPRKQNAHTPPSGHVYCSLGTADPLALPTTRPPSTTTPPSTVPT